MKKQTLVKIFLSSLIGLTTSVISVAAVSLAWFMAPNVTADDNSYLNGSIELRNYFFSGNGTESKPYEIVSPIHFYNLTRLQNLGIFPEKKYFQIGHVFDIDGTPSLRCINDEYDENGDPILRDYLDMGPFSSSKIVLPIGDEGCPFVGTIDGKGMPIRNLKVQGYPEDIGVFGYVASEGVLSGLVFDNLEVVSLGYNSDVTAEDYNLFSQDIDDIFDVSGEHSYLKDAYLELHQYSHTTSEYGSENLKKLNGVSGTTLVDINKTESPSNVYGDTNYYNAYFLPKYPNVQNDVFSYTWKSSSPIIKQVKGLNMDGVADPIVLDLTPLIDSADFNTDQKTTQADAKIYLIATVEVDGFTFSRVIQSYKVECYNNDTVNSAQSWSASIFCDYAIQAGHPDDKNTNYHHGNNIGLVAGHVDGNISNCYVFDGRFKFNETGYHPIATETETALVGEIGSNVENSIDPDLGSVVNGEYGIMNFTKIYGKIRTDMTYPKTVKAGQRIPEGGSSMVNYISYKEFINQDGIGDFVDYLRYYDGKKDEQEFITYTSTSMGSGVWHDKALNSANDIKYDFNSVDFLWNNLIQDEPNHDRGLGVFKIVSTYNSGAKSGSYGAYMANNLGESRIINVSPRTKVYFSTAEYDHTKGGPSWGTNEDQILPLRGSTLPSYSDITSFEWPFSRDYNYCFELDLTQVNTLGGKDFLSNTDNPFLVNYLSSKLKDKYGAPIKPGSPRFGFMFRSSDNEFLPELSSYMPLKEPGDKHDILGDGKYYPSNCIVFRIDNANGANVSVVGNGGDICIYSYDPTTPTGKPSKLYSMRSSRVGTETSGDAHKYFTYDAATGETGTETVQNNNDMSDDKELYGHIFWLPQGDYVIGARSGDANLFYLAVQGQTEGTIGGNDVISIGSAVEDVDFLLVKPTLADYPNDLSFALFSYSANFNSTSGIVYMEVVEVDTKKYMKVRFATSPVFVLYVKTYSRHSEHTYYINNERIDTVNYTYPT